MKSFKHQTPKQILTTIIEAFCLTSENTKRVYEMAGLKGVLYNGKRNYYQVRDLLIRAINDEKAKEIINQMPFPFIGEYHGKECLKDFINTSVLNPERKYQYPNSKYWVDEVLLPLDKKKGYKLESEETNYGIWYR